MKPLPTMPIYAFECTSCGHTFDKLQKLSDPDPATCPSCEASASVKRCVTAPAFRLAGGGWYETDFKKDGDKKRNLAGGDAPAKAESAKSEPAAAAPAAPAAKAADA